MSLRGTTKWRRHLHRTAFGAVQVNNLGSSTEIAAPIAWARNDVRVMGENAHLRSVTFDVVDGLPLCYIHSGSFIFMSK